MALALLAGGWVFYQGLVGLSNLHPAWMWTSYQDDAAVVTGLPPHVEAQTGLVRCYPEEAGNWGPGQSGVEFLLSPKDPGATDLEFTWSTDATSGSGALGVEFYRYVRETLESNLSSERQVTLQVTMWGVSRDGLRGEVVGIDPSATETRHITLTWNCVNTES